MQAPGERPHRSARDGVAPPGHTISVVPYGASRAIAVAVHFRAQFAAKGAASGAVAGAEHRAAFVSGRRPPHATPGSDPNWL
jgi:hypothetical protein